MNKKLIKTLASITCGLGMALTIPSFVSSCGNSTFDTDPEKLKIEYQGNYLLWGSTQFDITEDHVVSADYDGTNLKDGFKISYESNNENLILNFEKIIGEGYKFKVDNNTPSGDYEFRIGVTYGDETIYSRVFYLGVRDFVPLSNFSVSNNGELSINLQNDYSKYDGIYVPDKLNDIVVKSIKFQNSSKHLTSIKTLAFDCESEVTTLDHYNYFDNLEVVELPKKLQAVNSYSLCCSKFNEEHTHEYTPLKKVIFDNVNWSTCFAINTFLSSSGYMAPANENLSEYVFNNLNNLEPAATDNTYFRALQTDYKGNGKVTLINCGFEIDDAKNFMNKTNRSMFNTNADSSKWTYIEK